MSIVFHVLFREQDGREASSLSVPVSTGVELKAVLWKGWAFEPGGLGVQGCWFSGDLGQVTSPLWGTVSSLVAAWPVVFTSYHSLP